MGCVELVVLQYGGDDGGARRVAEVVAQCQAVDRIMHLHDVFLEEFGRIEQRGDGQILEAVGQ